MLLDFLFQYSDKIVLCIDEYGYLHESLDGIDSIIQQKNDKYRNDSKLKLVLLGSSLDIMKNLIEKDNPLFGRFDIVTKDKRGYIFYEVKYQNKPIDENIIDDEIMQLDKLKIEYYNLGFISKNGFKLNKTNKYILIDLKDIF